MGRIIVTEFVSMDGVMEAPGGEEGYKHTAWTFEFPDEQLRGQDEGDGRRRGDVARPRHLRASRPRGRAGEGDQATADFREAVQLDAEVRGLHDSSEATWQNTTILRSLDDVARLKDEIEGDILAHGSNTLVHGLLGRDLIDVLRLVIASRSSSNRKAHLRTVDDKIVFDQADHRRCGSIVVHDTTPSDGRSRGGTSRARRKVDR